MNDSARVPRRRRPWPPAARAAVAMVAAGGLALSAAACGGSSGSHVAHLGSPTASPASSLAFSRCMRSNGVSNFPDPNSKGELPKDQVAHVAASDPQFVPARRACGHLLPNGGQPTDAQVQQAWNDMRNFARCMRSHGVAKWPDPTATSQQDQRPFFRTEEVGIDPNAPQVTAAIHACQRFLDTNNPLVTTQ